MLAALSVFSEDEMKDHYRRCLNYCDSLTISNFYLYSCHHGIARAKSGVSQMPPERDALDLRKLKVRRIEDRLKFLLFTLGATDNGYLETCRECRGRDTFPIVSVPRACQLPKKYKTR
jgi:hypothetical protein